MRKIYLWVYAVGILLMFGSIVVEGHASENAASILTPLLMMSAAAALCTSYLAQQMSFKNKIK